MSNLSAEPDTLVLESTPSQEEDERLIAACLSGDARAWEDLLRKYQRLIYSVPIRYGLRPQDAADVFQGVCLDLYRELPRLRDVGALRGWLLRVAVHRCYHLRRRERREQTEELTGQLAGETAGADELPVEELLVLEKQQLVRESISTLSERCQRLIRMLFFEDPPRPYEEVAQQLGLAKGSIGFTRGRCLEVLRKALDRVGV